MYKLVDYFFGKNDKTDKIEMKVRVTHYEPPEIEDPYSSSSDWVCSTEDEFKNLYDQIGRERSKIQSKFPQACLKIELSGKLKGLDIKEKFNDLDSYGLYLENNSLINKPSKAGSGLTC